MERHALWLRRQSVGRVGGGGNNQRAIIGGPFAGPLAGRAQRYLKELWLKKVAECVVLSRDF